jgi:hypothetical protein
MSLYLCPFPRSRRGSRSRSRQTLQKTSAGRPLKPEAHDGITGDIPPRGPCDTGMPWGTAGLVCLPSHHTGLEVPALARLPLPARRAQGGSNHLELLLGLGGDQASGIYLAALEHVGPGEQIASGQVLLDGGAHDAIWQGGWRRDHLRAEIRVVDSTGFGEGARLADPVGVPFTTIAGLQIVGRVDEQRRGRCARPACASAALPAQGPYGGTTVGAKSAAGPQIPGRARRPGGRSGRLTQARRR